jgi:hypothetical protein
MTHPEYDSAYRRLLIRLSERDELASWTPLRIGDEREQAPRWFRRAVADARSARRPVAATATTPRRSRSRERRESHSGRSSARGAPDGDPHTLESGQNITVQAGVPHKFASYPELDGRTRVTFDVPGRIEDALVTFYELARAGRV